MEMNEYELIFRQSKDDEYCRRNLPDKYYVYALKIGADLYIGSSVHVITRIRQHLYDLMNGTHCNIYMNQAFENSNEVLGYILDCADSKDGVLIKEQYYIDKYRPYLNIGTAKSKKGNYCYSKRKWPYLPKKKSINYPVDKDTLKNMLCIKSQIRAGLRELSYVAVVSFIDQYYHDEELSIEGIKKIDEIMSKVDILKF